MGVMPMEIFVSCVGDLATVGRLVVIVTPVRSPHGPPPPLWGRGGPASPWGLESFTLAVTLCSGQVEFLRGCDVSRTARAGRSLSGHILGGSVSALLVDCLQFTDLSLWITVYCLF